MSTPPTPDLPARDFRYELAGAFIDSGCTEFVSRKMADEFLAAHTAAVRTAALTQAADAAATWTGDDTPEEDRPGYDGATIDPEDRLRDAIDPEVGPGRREQLITEYRDMVVGEIAGELRRLAAAPSGPLRNCHTDEAARKSLTHSPERPCDRAQAHPGHKHLLHRANWYCPGVPAPTATGGE